MDDRKETDIGNLREAKTYEAGLVKVPNILYEDEGFYLVISETYIWSKRAFSMMISLLISTMNES